MVKQVRLLVQRRQGEGDPRRRRLQGHERRRVRREQGRVADRPEDRLPERVVRLDDRDPGDRRQREGRRDQDHAGVPRVRHAGRRPRPRQLRPAARQRPAVQQHAVDVLPVHLPAADPEATRRRVNYERYTNPTAWNLTKQLDKTPSTQHQGVPGDDDASCRRPSCRICPRSRSGTTACGRWSTRSTGRTGRPATSRQYTPTSWRNYWQMTGIDMLTQSEAPRARRRGARPVTAQHPSRLTHREGCCVCRRPCERPE